MTIRLRSGVSHIRELGRRLARDTRGNALILMAAGIVPVTAAIGAGVDMTRGYMAQARLQEAVDAAALAGRKAMDGTDISTAATTVNKFIAFNYPNGLYGTPLITTDLQTTTDGALIVKASGSVPTFLMSAFGIQTMPIAAQSSAKRAGTNVEVILVLDVTGSMDYDINNKTANHYKIQALQAAAKSFLSSLDSTRQQLASSGLYVRVGIIPYSQTVNIGRYLREENSAYVATSAPYATQLTTPYKTGSGSSQKWTNKTTSSPWLKTTIDLTNFLNAGGASGSTYSKAYAWKGCVEARDTVTTITSTSDKTVIPAGAWDLIDAAPGTVVNGKTAPNFRPYFALPQTDSNQYGPPTGTQATTAPWNTMNFTVQNDLVSKYASARYYAAAADPTASSLGGDPAPNTYCPVEVKPLNDNDARQTESQLASYIDSLKPVGSTLHDIGMYWAIAMLSPAAPLPNPDPGPRGRKQYIVFMTDGDMDPNEATYAAWGVENQERRVDSSTSTADNHTLSQHNKRFDMLCEAAKRQGINISTVAFGTGVTSQLQNCATTTDQAYLASNADDLNNIFKQIAQNIGYLRLSQ